MAASVETSILVANDHLTSVGGIVFALLHAYQMGTDATVLAFRIGFVALAAVASYAGGLRLFALIDSAARKA